ncbi:beta-1,3-N-acetylglucosaminyltransferase radical fringe-like isoform X2 [Dysidea avara]
MDWSLQYMYINSQLNLEAVVSPNILSNVYISVKTAPKHYDRRLSILKKTWFQKVNKEEFMIVSDYVNDSFTDLKQFEDELTEEGFHIVRAKCVLGHRVRDLCCKSGVEYEQFYNYLETHKSHGQQVQWYCHFDDDVYVNVKELSNLLSKYDQSKPYYVGRFPRPGGVSNVSQKMFWYLAGATYCISLPLMMKLEKYFNGMDKFQNTCDVSGYPGDMTVGAIIELVLGYNVTHVDNMYTDLKNISTEALSKLITISFGSLDGIYTESKIDPQLRLFTDTEDPTRFLTYHCLLYKDTSWCNTGQ